MKIVLRQTVVLVFLFILTNKTSAQTADSVNNYIDSAIYFMQSKSLFGKDLDWTKIRDSAHIKAKDARTYKDAFPAIVYAFRKLKDFHGMLATHDSSYRYPPPFDISTKLSIGIKKEFLKGNRIVTGYFDSDIAYLRVPAMNVFSQEEIDKRANMLRDSLCYLLSKHPKRIIIDLRMNAGGNSAPMITGISPLFKDTILGYGVDRDGKYLSPTKIRNGVSIDENGNNLVSIITSCYEKVNLPIAVLIGPSTVSSGEILTVYLAQQKNVKLFGEPTPGFCNATEGFLFMNGHGYLLLSVNKIANAKKHIYHEMIVRPDKYIKADDNYEEPGSDPTVIAAITWLKSR